MEWKQFQWQVLWGMATQECCQELSNFHMQVLTEATKTPQRCYATGYLLPYTAETWTQWRNKFQAQTGTTYFSQSGKQKNAGKGNGVVEVGGKMEEFRVSWSHTYRCFRGGKPRLNPEVKNPPKHRWVKNHLIPKHKQEGVIQETPSQYDSAYFPTTKDLCNVAQQAVMQSRSSCFDQVCIRGG